MKSYRTLKYAATLAIAVVPTFAVHAQVMDHSKMEGMRMDHTMSGMSDLTDGEVRKIDRDARKITIRHGDIKNLGMPAMTMVFQVADVGMLEQVKAGDKVKFKVEKSAGAMVVTEMHAVK